MPLPLLRSPIARLLLLLLPAGLSAAPGDRIARNIDGGRRITMRGSVPSAARQEFDVGRADRSFRVKSMMLTIKPTAAQRAELAQAVKEIGDASSARYRKWLTPEQFRDRFGASEADYRAIVSWLERRGFAIERRAQARNFVVFNGTAEQVEAAFGAAIHRYRVGERNYFANATDIQLPEALAGMVAVSGLDNMRFSRRRPKARPLFTSGSTHFLAPDDLATIYNISPLYADGLDGAGQFVAVVGQTDIPIGRLQAFRDTFGLPNLDLWVRYVGETPEYDEDDAGEALLDLEWVGAVARKATVVYVNSSNVMAAAAYAIDDRMAPVISMSYGACEAAAGEELGAALEAVAQEAAALGITWIASSGDSGAAACEDPNGKAAKSGLAVNVPASLPEVTAVGGTMFREGSGRYWSSTNTSSKGSALSYIPEAAWNESAAGGLWSAGGGVSRFFARPQWQTGAGVPEGATRLVPDVSLTAAGHDAYLVCCESDGSPMFVSGTSASAPAFAGIVVLLNQYLLQRGDIAEAGLGNINPVLYAIAERGGGAFHDVVEGSNQVPCAAGSPDCSGGVVGYAAGKGYDMATGLGSIDAYALVRAWTGSGGPRASTKTALSASATQIVAGAQVVFTATVTSDKGTPTGAVTFSDNSGDLCGASLDGSATASCTTTGLATGSHSVVARYGGDDAFAPSVSASVAISVGMPAPDAPALMTPADQARRISSAPTLIWAAAGNATSYDVYFGVASPPPLRGNTTRTTYDLTGLATGTTYYWRVVAKNSSGSTSSATRTFSTIPGYTIATVAGTHEKGYSGDGGPGTAARLTSAGNLALDASGNLYITDGSRIRKLAANGMITTFAGTGTAGFSGDGGRAAAAQPNSPRGLAFDSAGNLYVADSGNHRIRKITPAGIISTIAGTGVSGFAGDGGPASSAALQGPTGLCIDASGNLFFVDSASYRVRKISASGVISTVAGNGKSGDGGDEGPALSAPIEGSSDVAVDANGNLYIAQWFWNRVRKVTPDGVIHSAVGKGLSGGSRGDGVLATDVNAGAPAAVAVDAEGALYVSSTGDERVRVVGSDGRITTIAGSGRQGYSGDGGAALSAALYEPEYLAVDRSGNIYFSDLGNYVVRILRPNSAVK